MDGDIPGGRSGPLYGSEGWGFESLRARHISASQGTNRTLSPLACERTWHDLAQERTFLLRSEAWAALGLLRPRSTARPRALGNGRPVLLCSRSGWTGQRARCRHPGLVQDEHGPVVGAEPAVVDPRHQPSHGHGAGLADACRSAQAPRWSAGGRGGDEGVADCLGRVAPNIEGGGLAGGAGDQPSKPPRGPTRQHRRTQPDDLGCRCPRL